MRIGLINIGDELLLGKILNTNAFDLAGWAGELGHELAFTLTVGDRNDAITGALCDGAGTGTGTLPHCEMVILTGGLGPTPDDLTRDAIAEFLGVSLEFSPEAADWLSVRLGVKAGEIAEGQRQQLYVPHGSTPLRNPAGTACGFRFEKNGVDFFVLPGVPTEFRSMFDAHCRPLLSRRDAVLLRKRLFTFGLPESRQRELLREFAPPAPFRFSSLPSESGGVAIALEAFVKNAEAEIQRVKLEAAWRDLLSRLPYEFVVDSAGATLTETVFQLLHARHATVSVAESCTAGALGYLLTEVPGSSEMFMQGYLTYSNQAKTDLLGVPTELLIAHGAVSEPVALAMAQGCRKTSHSDYAVAITGIAGPGGATAEKPVGLVYIAVASSKGAKVNRFLFRGNRKSIRWSSAYSAINLLKLFIINEL